MEIKKMAVLLNSRRRQRGATLVEVLVSVLLMSITLLGIAGLFSATLRYQFNIEARSSITYLFNDLTGRIRSNLNTTDLSKPADWAKHYTSVGTIQKTWTQQQSESNTPSKTCGTESGTATACTRDEIAELDLLEIRASLAKNMPQPALQLSGDASTGMVATFMWFDKNFTAIESGEIALQTSATCTASMNAIQQQSCCPTAAAVADTPGVRCLNFRFTP